MCGRHVHESQFASQWDYNLHLYYSCLLYVLCFIEPHGKDGPKHFEIRPEFDGPHKFAVLVNLPKRFSDIFANKPDTGTQLGKVWKSFLKVYLSVRKVYEFVYYLFLFSHLNYGNVLTHPHMYFSCFHIIVH